MKLSILDAHAVNPGDLSWDIFKPFADITVYERTPENLVTKRIGESDAVFINKIAMTRKVLSECENLKYIGVLATGYNVVDIEAAKERKIVVTNIPAYSTMAVAQHTFSLITYFSNHVAFHNESVRKGGWIKNPNFCYWNKPLIELDEKKIGIFGYGNIGKQVEKIAVAFGMKPLVVPHRFSPEIKNSAPLEKMLSESDFISLHSPLTKETEKIINAKTIEKMKNGVFVINTARGGLVDEKDVRDALETGKIKGYAADVLSEEPMRKDSPLYKAPNCVLTPHIAWAPKETRERLMNIALENLKGWLCGNIKNSIY